MTFFRLPAVKAETGFLADASIYNAIKKGLFTKPVLIGQRAVAWPKSEVQAICAARIAGYSNEQIKNLVDHLHSRRQGALAHSVIENSVKSTLASKQAIRFSKSLEGGEDETV
jgi:prophage regulatory protein